MNQKENILVLVNKSEFQLAQKNGFRCGEHYIRTVHGRKYAISDYDFVMMKKFIENRFKITTYR